MSIYIFKTLKGSNTKKIKKVKEQGPFLYILTSTPFHLWKNKADKEMKDSYFCVDLTGRDIEKEQQNNSVIKIRNAIDPTSLYMLLEQLLPKIRSKVLVIESLKPFVENLNPIELKRFYTMLDNLLLKYDVKLKTLKDEAKSQ
jgi:hypothetical protein